MPTLILTCKKNKKYSESLLKALNERGLSDITLKSEETEEELCQILKDNSYFDAVIFLGEASLLEKIGSTLSIPLKASAKAISKIESYCTAFGKDPLDFRQNVLILNGSAPILQKGVYCGCAIPMAESLLIYLPLMFDEIGIEKTAKLLSSHNPSCFDPEKGKALSAEMQDNVKENLSDRKFKCSKTTVAVLIFILSLCFIGISLGLYGIASSGDDENTSAPSEEESILEEVHMITLDEVYEQMDVSYKKMQEGEQNRQDQLKKEYEEEREALLEAEKIRQQELEAQRLEQERQKAEAQKPEQEKLKQQQLEQQRLEQQKLEQQKLEAERLEKERLEKERLEKERLEKERLEQERLEQERLEQEEEYTDTPSTDEEIYATVGGKVKAINAYDLMLYAVQNETHGNMHQEALKAQAVASYTFFKYNNIHGVSPTLNTNLTISRSTKNAVDAVFGEAIYYNGNYINAVYHSTSCGETASAKDVWGTHLPYLVSVDSSWDEAAPRFQTAASVRASDFKEAVENAYGIYLEDGDEENWITIESHGDGGYVGTVSLGGETVSQGGSFGRGKKITGRSIREHLLGFKIRSHCFDVSYDSGNDRFIFDVRGYGHGVGMSQYGAQFMAQDGYTYKEILEHYYVGTTIK